MYTMCNIVLILFSPHRSVLLPFDSCLGHWAHQRVHCIELIFTQWKGLMFLTFMPFSIQTHCLDFKPTANTLTEKACVLDSLAHWLSSARDRNASVSLFGRQRAELDRALIMTWSGNPVALCHKTRNYCHLLGA